MNQIGDRRRVLGRPMTAAEHLGALREAWRELLGILFRGWQV